MFDAKNIEKKKYVVESWTFVETLSVLHSSNKVHFDAELVKSKKFSNNYPRKSWNDEWKQFLKTAN